ncbi:MAG TPA: hypothetical protein VH763_11145 [Gemmatimonadales bacterium]|jgi:hypothetical protein
MNDERRLVRGVEAGRWLVFAILILLGIVLYFRFAPSTRPVAPPAVPEGQ